jgi:hypothetical protein
MDACATIHALGRRPSVRTVAALLKAANDGRGFRSDDVRRAMPRDTPGTRF